jgi:hypothetical protein
VDSSVVNTTGATTVGVYTLTYHAGSAGQNLSITYTQDTVTGNLALQAATLAGSTTPNFSLSASPASQSVATGGSVTYNVTVTPSGGFSGTVTLGVTGAPTGTVVSSTSSSAIKLTVPSSAKAATYPLQITGASVGLTRSTPVTLIVTSASSGPQIAGSLAAPPAAVNLSSEGKADWAHWDLNSDTDFDHRAGITPLIGNYTVIGTVAAHRYTNNTTAFSWTGGTPNASASSTTTGAYTSLQNNGFRITAPADIGFRTLRVYVGVWQAQGKLVAHLSDGSAADFVDTSLTNASGPATPGVYTLLYRAATNGQKLIVTFTNNSSNGNVELQAATLY